MKEYGLTEVSTLEALQALQEALDEWKMILEPGIGLGTLDELRVLTGVNQTQTERRVKNDVAQGEGQRVEFKRSLALDVDKHLIGGVEIAKCYSDEVLLSALKTVAGFMNTQGGILLIGIDDNGTPCSIAKEFPIICPKGNESVDGWELAFRGKVEQLFLEGASLQAYIEITFCIIDGQQIARLAIGPRSRLTFMTISGQDRLYLRVGNRTQNIRLSQIEDFLQVLRVS
ncbi:MAG: ATP-binding protein [Sphingomicrobium sp.]